MLFVISIFVILSILIRGETSAEDYFSICEICECLQSSIVECDNLDLTEIPVLRGNEILSLSFDGNSISNITKLPELNELRRLSLRFNTIVTIQDSAFAELPYLSHLDLSYNYLTENSLGGDVFKGSWHGIFDDSLENLKCLNLSSNRVKRLTTEMFRRLDNLSILSLRNNPLQDLSANSVSAFSSLRKLEDLDLAYTELQRLPSHMFADLRHLKNLDLSGNHFEHFPSEINFIPSLRNLILNNLLWTSIRSNYFYESLENLESLLINHSLFLTEVENYAFANLTGLRSLIITHNPHLSKFNKLSLSSKINKTLNLDEVNLSYNHLKHLPQFAIEWSTIEKLDLQHNPWECDCHFEWIAKGLIPQIAKRDKEVTLHIICSSPKSLMGKSVISNDVQETQFICYDSYSNVSVGASVIILFTIFVSVLSLSAGTIFFAYALFKRTQSKDWAGSHIQYRRVNEPITQNSP